MKELITTSRAALIAEFKAADLDIYLSDLWRLLIEKNGTRTTQKSPNKAWSKDIDKTQVLSDLGSQPITYAIVFTFDQLEHHFVYECEHDDSILLLTVLADTIRIVSVAKFQDIFSAFAELLRPAHAAPPFHLEFEMSHDALIALSACIDRIRLLFAASLMERSGFDAISFSIVELQEQISTGTEIPDYRWLCAILPHLLPDKKRLTSKVTKACNELVFHKLLTKQSINKQVLFSPSKTLLNIAHQIMNPLPAVIFNSCEFESSKDETKTAIIGGTSLWYIQCGSRKSTLRCIDGLEAMAVIQEQLRNLRSTELSLTSIEKPEKGKIRTTRNRQYSKISQINKPDISKKGSTDEQNKVICSSCHAKNPSTNNFCSSCGVPFEA